MDIQSSAVAPGGLKLTIRGGGSRPRVVRIRILGLLALALLPSRSRAQVPVFAIDPAHS
jgi:hypothetical protein